MAGRCAGCCCCSFNFPVAVLKLVVLLVLFMSSTVAVGLILVLVRGPAMETLFKTPPPLLLPLQREVEHEPRR